MWKVTVQVDQMDQEGGLNVADVTATHTDASESVDASFRSRLQVPCEAEAIEKFMLSSDDIAQFVKLCQASLDTAMTKCINEAFLAEQLEKRLNA